MKNRDIIITVVVVALIGWLVVRHFCEQKNAEKMTPAPHTTEKPVAQ